MLREVRARAGCTCRTSSRRRAQRTRSPRAAQPKTEALTATRRRKAQKNEIACRRGRARESSWNGRTELRSVRCGRMEAWLATMTVLETVEVRLRLEGKVVRLAGAVVASLLGAWGHGGAGTVRTPRTAPTPSTNWRTASAYPHRSAASKVQEDFRPRRPVAVATSKSRYLAASGARRFPEKRMLVAEVWGVSTCPTFRRGGRLRMTSRGGIRAR
mmetsp:Transcript_13303/g.32580  ORF Transcript_13303/g.32580 Transcript_13303/m.32580 type:complete len:215 (-) Transcript_13303:4711-5355(-)